MGPAHVASLNIQALAGGVVDLGSVTHITDAEGNVARQADLLADGVGSQIDLSSLTNLTHNSSWDANWRSSLTSRNGGTIDAPNLNTLRRVDVVQDGTGTLAIDNWQHWHDGIATLSGADYTFDTLESATAVRFDLADSSVMVPLLTNADASGFNLTGGSVDLPLLTSLEGGSISLTSSATAAVPELSNIAGATFIVNDGVVLAIPKATGFTQPTARTAEFRASGVGSVLDLGNVTSIDMGPAHVASLNIQALAGGVVDLGSVTHITDAEGNVARQADLLADGVGSQIDLSSLTNFTHNSSWDANWRSSINSI